MPPLRSRRGWAAGAEQRDSPARNAAVSRAWSASSSSSVSSHVSSRSQRPPRGLRVAAGLRRPCNRRPGAGRGANSSRHRDEAARSRACSLLSSTRPGRRMPRRVRSSAGIGVIFSVKRRSCRQQRSTAVPVDPSSRFAGCPSAASARVIQHRPPRSRPGESLSIRPESCSTGGCGGRSWRASRSVSRRWAAASYCSSCAHRCSPAGEVGAGCVSALRSRAMSKRAVRPAASRCRKPSAGSPW